MGVVSLPNIGGGVDPATINVTVLNGKVDPLATEFNGSIENVNIKSTAAIAASKLNLTTIAQSMVMSSKQFLTAKGADVASATSITLGTDGNCFDITGTTTIQTIATKQAGSIAVLHFDGALTLTDDTGNLELQGSDLVVAAEDEVILKSDGTNWHLVAHSSRGGNLTANNVWTGTQEFQDTIDMTAAPLLGASPIVLEGATANDFETTVAVVDPTADRTVTIGDEDLNLAQQCVKAWVKFDGSNTPGYTDQFNFTGSITDGGTGIYTLTIDVDFANANYAFTGMCRQSGAGITTDVYVDDDNGAAAGTIQVTTQNAGSVVDATEICLILIGDRS